MTRNINITKANYPEIINSRTSSQINLMLILLIVFHAEKGNSKYITMNKLAYIYDLILCDKDKQKMPKQKVSPWIFSRTIKKIVIQLLTNNLIDSNVASVPIRFSITEQGRSFVNKIKTEKSFEELNSRAFLAFSSMPEVDMKIAKVII